MCEIDHIVIVAPSLNKGADLVKKTLRITPETGGEHPKMGTHNLLLRLGDAIYLEVIACNPNAIKPNRPRWFGLDQVSKNTPAQLKSWVVRTNDMSSTLKSCSEPIGKIEPMRRGNFNWLITIPENGDIPIHQGAPSLIQWKSSNHPASELTDYGLSFIGLTIYNSEPERISNFIQSIRLKGNIEVIRNDTSKIVALINTPKGVKKLNA